jgi:cysteate synthase
VEEITAKVLSNRKPPYSIIGGLYDALLDTDGDVILASNQDAEQAAKIFLETEGIDIHPAAAVATASLISSVRNGSVDKHSTIMLNITGGGEMRFKSDKELFYLKPSVIFPLNPELAEVEAQVQKLF